MSVTVRDREKPSEKISKFLTFKIFNKCPIFNKFLKKKSSEKSKKNIVQIDLNLFHIITKMQCLYKHVN